MIFKNIAGFALASAIALGLGGSAVAANTAGEPTQAVSTQTKPNITGVWERYPSPFPEGLSDADDIPPP